jgi:ribonuclease D
MDKPENKEKPLYQYIDSSEGLTALLERLRPLRSIALDTEADSFHHYQPKVCLIQLSFDDETDIVDPLADIDIPALLEALADKELIIHDAGYDLRLLYADFGFKPRDGVFDTRLAAALAGMDKVGLSDVLHHVTGVKVGKHNQRADWSKRPLPGPLLTYAAEDTASLIEIKAHLAERLDRLGRTDWHVESCRAAVEAALTLKETADPEVQWRVKGMGKLPPKEMAFLRQLWYWREAVAQATNIAPFMICRNEDMLKLAAWGAKRKKTIDADTQLPIRPRSRHLDGVIQALQTAQALPKDQWPGRRKSDPSKKLSEGTRHTVNALKTECEKIAAENNLPLNLIASRAALNRIVLHRAATLDDIRAKNILLNWQAALLLPAIQKVLAP